MPYRLRLAFILAAVLLPAGCSDRAASGELSHGQTSNFAATLGKKLTAGGVPPAESDVLVMQYPDDPDTFNYVTAHDTISYDMHTEVYEGLARHRFKNPDEWEPALAESWEFDKERLEYTFHLRHGVMWHPIALPNGQILPPREFTSKDVKFTFDCILNPYIEAASKRSYYEDPAAKSEEERIKIRVTAVDPYTVTVRWTKPYFAADEYTMNVLIIPRHVFSVDENGEPISFDFSGREFADGFNNHWANGLMCGTGPLVFKEWAHGDRVVFERNPDYWGAPFYFSIVIWRHIANANTVLQQALQNDLDFGIIPQKDLFVQSRNHPNVVAGKVVLDAFDYPGFRYIGYNEKRELFKDKRVRWALSHATPVGQIIEKIYFGLAKQSTGPFLRGTSFSNDSIPPVEVDLDEARRLLDEAGWLDSDGDGVRDRQIGGVKVDASFDLMIYDSMPQYLAIAQIFKENCRRIGVSVDISPTKWALMLQKLRTKEYDATMLGWALDWKSDPFQVWHGSQADLADSSNSIGYRNAEVDRLIEELQVALDPAEQSRLGRAIHRQLYDDQPYTFLFQDQHTAGRNSRLKNVGYYLLRPCYDIREWWADKPRALGD